MSTVFEIKINLMSKNCQGKCTIIDMEISSLVNNISVVDHSCDTFQQQLPSLLFCSRQEMGDLIVLDGKFGRVNYDIIWLQIIPTN